MTEKRSHLLLIKITATELTLLMTTVTDWISNSWRSEI